MDCPKTCSERPKVRKTSVETSRSFGVTLVNGSYQAVLQTCVFVGACDDNQPLTNAKDLESFLGLSGNQLSNLSVVEGSAIKQTITANAGDVFSFSWNFLTDEDATNVDYNDFAFFTLNNTLYRLADIKSSFPVNPSFSHLKKETGYQTYTIPISVTGNYIWFFRTYTVENSPSSLSVQQCSKVDKYQSNKNSKPCCTSFTSMSC